MIKTKKHSALIICHIFFIYDNSIGTYYRLILCILFYSCINRRKYICFAIIRPGTSITLVKKTIKPLFLWFYQWTPWQTLKYNIQISHIYFFSKIYAHATATSSSKDGAGKMTSRGQRSNDRLSNRKASSRRILFKRDASIPSLQY